MGNIYVADSKIHGKGVFAASAFEEGDEILQIDDSYDVTCERASRKCNEDEVDYSDYLAGGKIVLMQPPERHINHSCDPNAYVRTIEGIRREFARRKIHQNEEITFDYSINNRDDTVRECNCGAQRCEHVVAFDFFRLPIERQREYLHLLDDWFLHENEKRVRELETGEL